MSFIANHFQHDVPSTNLRSRPLWNPGPRPLQEECILTMINPKTHHDRKILQQAFCKKFYERYHPINALKYSNLVYRAHVIDGEVIGYLDCSSLYVDDVKFSCIINMEVMLLPDHQNNKLIDNMMQALEIEEQDVPNG